MTLITLLLAPHRVLIVARFCFFKEQMRLVRQNEFGFTLIELMITLAIIGILAAVAIPKFAELIDRSKEGATKGNLGMVRSAITVYYGDMEGEYPVDNLSQGFIPKYLEAMPVAKVPALGESNAVVTVASAAAINDTLACWAYVNTRGDASWGTFVVDSVSTDSKGIVWSMH